MDKAMVSILKSNIDKSGELHLSCDSTQSLIHHMSYLYEFIERQDLLFQDLYVLVKPVLEKPIP